MTTTATTPSKGHGSKGKSASLARSNVPYTSLHSGVSMPLIGVGTWVSEKGATEHLVDSALRIGYPLVDAASQYGNEHEIGDTLERLFKEGVVKREDLFIITKLFNDKHRKNDVMPAIKDSLKKLKLDYVDLYLMHFPVAFKKEAGRGGQPEIDDSVPLRETWEAIEAVRSQGLARDIGVANFEIDDLKNLLSFAKIKPVVNQVEMHPYYPNNELLRFCKEQDIAVMAYSPLGAFDTCSHMEDCNPPKLLEDRTVREIAAKHKVEPAQVLLRWGLQRDTCVIPKSTSEEHLKDNFQALKLRLDREDMEKLDNIKTRFRFIVPSWMQQRGWRHTPEGK